MDDERFPIENIVTLPDGSLMAWGTAPMHIPGGGAHVRQVRLTTRRNEFYNPNATVMITIVGEGSVGETFGVSNITFDEPVIKITASNVIRSDAESHLDYFCHFVIISQPKPQ